MNPFILQLKARLEKPLPGEEAQFLMAPAGRERVQSIRPEVYDPRKSAVLILLFPDNDRLYTVLIERPVYEGVHSGQIAFPGGKYEEADGTTMVTALREAQEEAGIDPEGVEVIGRLSDIYINPSNYLVTPYIGYTSVKPDFIPDPREVSRLLIADLLNLAEGTPRMEKMITFSNGMKIKSPYFEIEGFTVWGATAMIISELNAVVSEAKAISF